MLFGQDGNLYVLEYGESWNTKNLDAQLNKISFVAGNRAPIAKVTGDQTMGGLPLTVNFSAESSLDLEGDPLIYRWDFGDGNTAEGINVSHQFTQAGNYQVTMTVSDDKGLSSSTSYQIVAGNEAPVIRVSFTSDNTFYTRKTPLQYTVEVTDQEDGELGQGIDARQVSVSLDFLPEGMDRIVAKPGHQVAIEYLGKEYIALSDCAACHAIDHKVNGPSYKQIANKYAATDLAYLQEKIRNGGNGVWGETAMVAHPQLTEKETSEIVKYILSLADDYEVLPVTGQLRFTQHDPQNLQGAYLLTVTYTDRGGEGVEPITTQEQIIMKAAMLEGEKADEKNEEISTFNVDGNTLIRNLKDGRYIRYDDVLFDHLAEISLRLYYDAKNTFAGMIEVRRGASDGLLLGSVTTSHPLAENNKSWDNQSVRLKESAGRDKLYLVFRNTASPDTPVANLDYLVLGYQD
jgi:cytochrome c